MNGLMLIAWIIGLGVLCACYMVARAILGAGEAPEDDLSLLDMLDGVGQRDRTGGES